MKRKLTILSLAVLLGLMSGCAKKLKSEQERRTVAVRLQRTAAKD